MKYVVSEHRHHNVLSLPAWGVRVEILPFFKAGSKQGHSPHGECGLKCAGSSRSSGPCGSLPAWGVRVEIGTRAPFSVL